MRFVIVFLALCGIVVSSLALHVHYSTDIEPCSINAKWDCGIVNHSRFSMIGSVPVAAIGIAGYSLLGLLGWLRLRRVLLGCSLVALAFALYLTHIEADLLRVWCLYCVISQGIIALIAIFSVVTALSRPAVSKN